MSASLMPSDTVTFLLTDIEGSTQLWENYPDQMAGALARHDEILQQTITAYNGSIFKKMGDAFLAAFTTAPLALQAAIEIQRNLQKEVWTLPKPQSLKVRIALHTGTAELRDGDYYGQSLNRAARTLAAAHGGQVLLTNVTQELVRDHLPAQVRLLDLGQHRLKDLIRPEWIFQALAPDLANNFPPLRTLELFPNNLPFQLTAFIGREKEMQEVAEKLNKVRLLTLTGTGGAGKTRLSVQLAAELVDDFKDGVWFVELAALSDPNLIPQTVAATLGLSENKLSLKNLLDYLKKRELLLILDNCEHLIEPCARLADTLLKNCPDITVLATSREVLNIPGEVSYNVPPLTLPDPQSLPSIPQLSQYEAVRLFIDRAVAVQPAFSVTLENAPAVAQICYQLDGIPLALELAAARVRMLTVEQIAQRLDDRFRLLTGGSRVALPRQQTLRALIDWSYDLLTAKEQLLFRWLAVFKGGWSLEAAEKICSGAGLENFEILELLQQLVNKSLISAEETGERQNRYRMLETIRHYALEKLQEQPEPAEALQNAHLAYYVDFSRQALPVIGEKSHYLDSFDQIEVEHDNLRAALQWSVKRPSSETTSDLVRNLTEFWNSRGYVNEGRHWLESAVKQSQAVGDFEDERQIHLLGNLAQFAKTQGDLQTAKSLLQQVLPLIQNRGDQASTANIQNVLGVIALENGNLEEAETAFTQALALWKTLGDRQSLCPMLINLGGIARRKGEWEKAQSYFDEALAIFKELGNRYGELIVTVQLAQLNLAQKKITAAAELINYAAETNASLNDIYLAGLIKSQRGQVAELNKQPAAAEVLYKEALENNWKAGILNGLDNFLESLAKLYTAQDQAKNAVRLFGQVAKLRATREKPEQAAEVDQLKTRVPESEFAELWQAGYTANLEEIVSYVLTAKELPKAKTAESSLHNLSEREVEVLKLVAQGLTDSQIAEKLVISPRTVSKHLQSIYAKLEVSSRSAATRYAFEHKIA